MKRPYKLCRYLLAALAVAAVVNRIRHHHGTPIEVNNDSQNTNLRTYLKYSTTHQHYRIWPDYLFEIFNFPAAVTLGAIMVSVFSIGLVIAWPFGFVTYYIATPAVYLGLAGIALTIGGCHWGSSRAHHDYEQLRPVFTVDDVTYYHMLDKWFMVFRSRKAAALTSSVFFIIGLAALILAYITSSSARRKFGLETLRPYLVGPVWYTHQFDYVGFSILLFFLILISITLGTGCWVLISNIVFLWKLRRLPVIPMPTIVRTRLRRMSDLYVGTSLTWSFGVALFGILFYRDYNLITGIFLASLFIIGTLMFSLPQVICRSHVVRSHEQLCAIGLAELYEDLGMSLQERNQAPTVRERVADNLSDLYAMTDRPKTLVYDVQNVVFWVGSELVALAAIIPHTLLIGLLHFFHV